MALASLSRPFFSGAIDATRYPFSRATPFDRASSLLGRDTSGLRAAARYDAFVRLLDELRLRLLIQGVSLRDRLDAQGLLWWVMSADPPDSWSEQDKAEFLAFRERRSRPKSKPQPGETVEMPPPEHAWLVRGANVDGTTLVPEWLEEGYVSIGWWQLGQLQPGVPRTEIADKVRDAFADDSPGSQRAAVGNVHRFVNVVHVGDLVLTPDRDSLYIGRITSDPSFDPSIANNAARRRSVEWLNLASPASRSRGARLVPRPVCAAADTAHRHRSDGGTPRSRGARRPRGEAAAAAGAATPRCHGRSRGRALPAEGVASGADHRAPPREAPAHLLRPTRDGEDLR